jgi:cell division protein ZapA
MTHIKTCMVKILNKSYEIRCPETEEANLSLAADKLSEHILANRAKSKSLDQFQILLLAALEISHELIICKQEQEQHQHHVTQFISSLEHKISKVVGKDIDTMPQTD